MPDRRVLAAIQAIKDVYAFFIGEMDGVSDFDREGIEKERDNTISLLEEFDSVEHAKEIMCRNGWEKMRFPDGSIGKWDDPEIVRCRDCRNYYKGHCQCDDTIYWNRDPEWFCADGERRTDDACQG